jgi:hypothetical protein
VSEAIASDEALGGQRRELLENIAVLAEQGNLPAARRKTGFVKSAFQYIAQITAVSGGITTVWNTWGPHITAFFALPR